MDKAAFAALFHEAVETACLIAEEALGRTLNRDVIIKAYVPGLDGREVEPQAFLDAAYISDEIFYRLIDLSVIKVVGSTPVLFARVSGHTPGSLSRCWNGENGPFKQLGAGTITIN
jgi:hypothetical protein